MVEEISLSLQIKPEVREVLTRLVEQLDGIDASLKEIRTLLAKSLHKILELSNSPPDLPEAVVAQEKSPAARAED